MPYVVQLADGQPRDLFESLEAKVLAGKASKRERQLAKKIATTIGHLERDPGYHRLETHEIKDLSRKYKRSIYCSYVEKKRPGAYRMLWARGPGEERISVQWIGPHPPKGKGYSRVKLADYPEPDMRIRCEKQRK